MVALRLLLGAGLLYAASLWWAAGTLPDRVPLHFGGSLEADRFGSRTELVVVMALVGLLMLALFAGLWLLARKGSLTIMNIPHREHWVGTAREPELRRRLQVDMATLGAATLVLLSAILVLVVRATESSPPRLSPFAWAVLGAYLALVLGWSTWIAVGRYRPDDER